MGFAGYKAGMTTISFMDNRKSSMTAGTKAFTPATILECPPMKVASVRLYGGSRVLSDVFTGSDPALSRRLPKHKKVQPEQAKAKLAKQPEGVTRVSLILQTQPGLTGIGKKKPEMLEIALGGTVPEQLAYAEQALGRDIALAEVLEPGMQVDVKAVTKGKGFQGTTKRYGTSVRPRKSEKHKRGAGNLGPWNPSKVSYAVPQPGKMGYHARTEYNKHIFKIGSEPSDVNPAGGFVRYGTVRNPYLVLRGSVPGPIKRLIRMHLSVRPNKLIPKEAPEITEISKTSKQGN